jgi:hypothetical protein
VLRRLTLTAFLLVVPVAQAGTATVHQCQTPRGTPAEMDLVGTAGHSEMLIDNRCASGGAYEVASAAAAGFNPEADFRREMTITAPAGTTFVGGRITRQMLRYVFTSSDPNNSSGWGYILTGGDDVFLERCGASQTANRFNCTSTAANGETVFPNPAIDLDQIARQQYRILVGCNGGTADPNRCFHHRDRPGMTFARFAFVVRDDTAPQAQASGPLAEASPVRSAEVTLNAADQGLGVYRVKLFVDGAEAEVLPWDASDGRCRDADTSNGDPYEFAAGQPCKTQPGSRTFTFSKLPGGSHNIKVAVEDASGNQTVAVDRTVVVDLPGPANGTNASDRARIVLASPTRATVTSAYSNRGTLRLRGRVVAPNGQGVGNAVLDLFARAATQGAAEQRIALGNTAADGTFEVVVPAGASRTLRLVYRDRLGSVAETSVVTVVQRVRAGLRFGVSKKGRTLRFSGRLLGHRPRKALQIQVQVAGTWRVLSALKTRTGGAFKYRYALKTARRGERLRFRAVVPGERGFPYLGAASRTLTVKV